MPSRPTCAREGCRNWRLRTSDYCGLHSPPLTQRPELLSLDDYKMADHDRDRGDRIEEYAEDERRRRGE